jgi:hypothetical protein
VFPGSLTASFGITGPGKGSWTTVADLSYWYFSGTLPCTAECPEFSISTHAAPISIGLRGIVGADVRDPLLYFEFLPGVIYLSMSIHQPGFDQITEDDLLLGLQMRVVKPVVISKTRALEFGLGYLLSENYEEEGLGVVTNLSQLAFLVGIGW